MSQKKRQRKNKSQSKISKILSSSQTEGAARTLFFLSLSPGEITQHFRKIAQHRHFRYSKPIPSYDNIELFYRIKTPNLDFEKNIAWCCALLEHHKESINKYLDLEEILQKKILNNEIKESLQIIEAIDNECGPSIWSLSLRGAIESRYEIDEAESHSIKTILSSHKENDFLNFITKYSSEFFNDDEIFFTSTQNMIGDINSSVGKDFKDFYHYKFFSLDPEKAYNFRSISKLEKESSLVDIFNFLIDFIQKTLIPPSRDHKDRDTALKCLKLLSKNFNHPVLANISLIMGMPGEYRACQKSSEVLNHYINGEYEAVCDIAKKSGIYNFDIPTIELIARSNTVCQKISHEEDWLNIYNHIENITSKSSDYHESLEIVSCIAHNFRALQWFKQLNLFCFKETSSPRSEKSLYIDSLIFTHSRTTEARLYGFISTDKSKFSSKVFLYLDPTCIDIIKIISDNKTTLSETFSNFSQFQKKYFIENFLLTTNNPDFIEELKLASLSEDKSVSIRSCQLLANELLEANRIDEAIKTFIDPTLKNKDLIFTYDTEKIIGGAKNNPDRYGNIDYPIAFSLHSRFINSSHESDLRYSFEKFLNDNNVKHPKELFGKEEIFGKEKLHYFFKWVCTPDTMKLYFEFDNLRDIEDCRLEVCSYLMECGDTSEPIQIEVKEITKNHAIKKATKKVETSKIFVDTSGLTGRNSKQYRTLFDRYIDLCSKDFSDHEDEALFNEIGAILKNKPETKDIPVSRILSPIHFPHVKLNTKNATFLSLAKLVRSEFTYGEKGINNHLSTRIRHGVLPTALRQPLIEEQIYLPSSLKFDKFTSSFKWTNQNHHFGSDDTEKLFKNLRKTTADYEKLISEINDEWLQINTLEETMASYNKNKTSKGMFDYTASAIEVFYLQKELPISPSYEDFVRVSTKWLWEKTDHILTTVQSAFKDQGKKRALSILDTLKRNTIENLGSKPEVYEFCNAVDRAKSSLSTQIDLICSWFTHVDIEDNEQFDIETAIDIAKRALNIEVHTSNACDISISERELVYFVDIFFILFENAISKSNVAKDELNINLSITECDDNFIITTTNNCFTEESIDYINKNLDFYRDAYGDESLIKDTIQEEGGTGFFKIWKILEKDLEIRHDIEFNLDSSSLFSVTINLYSKERLLKS